MPKTVEPTDEELDAAVHRNRMATDPDYVKTNQQYNGYLRSKYGHMSDDDLRGTINAFADADPEAVEEMKGEAARRAGHVQRSPVGWEPQAAPQSSTLQVPDEWMAKALSHAPTRQMLLDLHGGPVVKSPAEWATGNAGGRLPELRQDAQLHQAA